MTEIVALYALVSAESHTFDNRIASQIAALQERTTVQGSSSNLIMSMWMMATVAPVSCAVEQLRDAVAAGFLDHRWGSIS